MRGRDAVGGNRTTGRGAPRRSRAILPFAGFLGGMFGCYPDPRVELKQFQQMERESLAAQAVPEGQSAPTYPIDDYLMNYRVGPGDVVDVALTGLNEPTATAVFKVRVDHSGRIDLPLVGEVEIGGKDAVSAEDAIQAAYVPAVVRQLGVNIVFSEFDPTNVVVNGAVTAPGLVPLRRTERNLLYAVLGAGGVSNGASGTVTLTRIRRPAEKESFDLGDPAQLASALALAPLENGDMIEVHTAMPNTIFVGGLVNRPGPQTFATGVNLSVLQVLASAGGLRTDITPREGSLIRRLPDGRDVHVKLNLDRIASGLDENIMLAEGDVFWVPDTVETRVQDFINKNIFLRAGISVNYNVTGLEFLNNNARQNSRSGGGALEDSFDPLGFLTQNSALQNLTARPTQ